jgi:hypothetical protein
VSDFLTQLRGEVLEAHAAQRRRGRAGRAARALAGNGGRAMVAAGAAAALALAVVASQVITPAPPGGPRVIDVIRVGGSLNSAVAAGGSVWVGDATGRRVVRLDARAGRVVQRIDVAGRPVALATGPGGTWVRTAAGRGGAVARLGSGTTTPVGEGSTLAAGRVAVWAADVELPPEGLRRIDARTGRDDGLLPRVGIYALAVGGDSLWAVMTNGTVLRLDARTGAERARWQTLAIAPGTADPPLVADGGGAWVLRATGGGDSEAIRLENDRIARHVQIPPTARPVLAQAGDGLWTITEDPVRYTSAAVRLDPRTGDVTARVALGNHNPTRLVAVRDEIWVTGGDGTVTVIGER